MALINRVALSNVLNVHGEDQNQWRPVYRYEVLNFFGQSTAMNLTNGGGKTTIAEGILAVLSRERLLISKTKQKFSPKSEGIYSHIQVELINPYHNVSQDDLLTQQGEQVAGDTWVFGMCGHRGADAPTFYYYHGTLEDCAIGKSKGHKRQLCTNSEFTTSRKSIKGFEWSPTREDWRDAVIRKANLSPSSLTQMVDFQKRGGQDKSALLFDIKRRPDETYAAAFFYQVLAPAVMEGVMDKEGEEDEVRLEDTIERMVHGTVKAKHDTQEKRQDLERLQREVTQLTAVVKAATEAEERQLIYQRTLKSIGTDVQLLTAFVQQGDLTGVPAATLPEGLIGQVAAHLVMLPGSEEPGFADAGIAELLGQPIKAINQLADRSHVKGVRITQVVEIPCDLKMQAPTHGGARYDRRVYSLKEASTLLKATTQSAQKLDAVSAMEILEQAVAWFERHGDTNSYRKHLIELHADLDQTIREEDAQEQVIERLQVAQNELLTHQREMQANEVLYNQLVNSGLFSSGELAAPEATGTVVDDEHTSAQDALNGFERTRARLEVNLPAWNSYTAVYGAHDPHPVADELKTKEKKLKNERDELINKNKQSRASQKGHQQSIQQQKKNIENTRLQVTRLNEWKIHAKRFTEIFGENTKAEGLAVILLDKRAKLDQKFAKLEDLQKNGERSVAAIARFRELHGDTCMPHAWLQERDSERALLTVDLQRIIESVEDTKRQRSALDRNPIAPNMSTQRAIDLLADQPVPFIPLHSAIDALGLAVDRKRHVLAVFSALLFAPVIENEADAIRAAKTLAANDIQIPIFLKHSIEEFCRSGAIKEYFNGKLIAGTTAGIVTRPVECLLDPALVEREKGRLDSVIGELQLRHISIEARLLEISNESESIVVARKAKLALEDNWPVRLPEVVAELAATNDALRIAIKQTASDVLECIRRTESFNSQGGHQKLIELTEEVAVTELKITELDDAIIELDASIADCDARLQQIDSDIEALYPDNRRTVIANACIFWNADGPAFFETSTQAHTNLKHKLDVAQSRYRFLGNFAGAQHYIDLKKSQDEGDNFQQRLDEISHRLQQSRDLKQQLRQRKSELEQRQPALKKTVESIDKAAIQAINKYKQIAQLQSDVALNGSLQESLEGLLAWDQSHKLRQLMQGQHLDVQNLDAICQISEELADTLAELNIDSKAAELRRARKEVVEAEGKFIEGAHALGDSADGLAPLERELLRQVRGLASLQGVTDLYEHLLDTVNKAEDRLRESEDAELKSRLLIADRLTLMIRYAADDLLILRKVAKENHAQQQAHFIIDAKVISDEECKTLINTIIETVEEEDTHRRRQIARGIGNVQDKKQFQTHLRTIIRNTIYRSIFREPTVKFVNENIRISGSHEFNENLSEGQKAALSLSWMIRLADFAVEREAQRMNTLGARRKMRERTATLIIVDGLFSNLSNRKLIKSAMAGIESTRGRFQLIGLIHSTFYENDFNVFPVFLIGKMHTAHGRDGWVTFEEGKRVKTDYEGSIGVAELILEPAGDDDGTA